MRTILGYRAKVHYDPHLLMKIVVAQNPKGEYSEMDPLCVLDFYVDEAHQRSGIGLQLFQRLLQVRDENSRYYEQLAM